MKAIAFRILLTHRKRLKDVEASLVEKSGQSHFLGNSIGALGTLLKAGEGHCLLVAHFELLFI